MKMRIVVPALMALMFAACGGTQVDEAPAPGEAASTEAGIGGGGPCGTNYCGKDSYCCNASCGVCAPIGGGCLDVMCGN